MVYGLYERFVTSTIREFGIDTSEKSKYAECLMEWFNYHHLLYFWLVAREGSLARASSQLRLAQSTVSGQIRAFENTLGEKLFVRSGRRFMLSEVGRVVY